jgi:hypothetical protein
VLNAVAQFHDDTSLEMASENITWIIASAVISSHDLSFAAWSCSAPHSAVASRADSD